MQRKYLIALVGVAALAVVGVAIFETREPPEKSDLVADKAPAARVNVQANLPDSELKSALDQIQALQLPPATRKRLIVTYLTSVVAPGSQPFAYWEPSAVRDARERLQRYETDEAARQQLRSTFGDGVMDDPEFAFLFRPYADRYPALDSAKQLELQKLSLIPAKALIDSELSPIQAQVRIKAAQREMYAQIAKLLSPQEMQEYDRKESPAARALASGGFRFTQTEFDAVFPTLAATGGEAVVKRFDPASTESLRKILGEKRFLDYRKSQDPTFQMLSTIVASHGKPDANVDAAYAAVYKNQETSAEMLRAGPVLSFDAQNKKDRMETELRNDLATNIGSEAAEIFMRSMDANRGLIQTRMF